MYNEIFKLNTMLTEAGIPHTFNHFRNPYTKKPDGYQIKVYQDKACTQELDDCVCNSFSYGHEQGLLETYNLSQCGGFETAQEVFDGWLKMYKDVLGE